MNNKSLWLTNLEKEKWSSRHPDHALKTSCSFVCSYCLHKFKVVNFKSEKQLKKKARRSTSDTIDPLEYLKERNEAELALRREQLELKKKEQEEKSKKDEEAAKR